MDFDEEGEHAAPLSGSGPMAGGPAGHAGLVCPGAQALGGLTGCREGQPYAAPPASPPSPQSACCGSTDLT